MTVIAARITDQAICFAADSQTTSGWSRTTAKEIDVAKLHSINGMIIGGTGLKSQTSWFCSFCRSRQPAEATEIAVSEFMLEFVEWMRKKSNDFESKNGYLLATSGSLFRIYDSLSVFKIPEFSAVGSGQDFAIAAMHLGHNVRDACGVAAKLDIHCGGGIQTASLPL